MVPYRGGMSIERRPSAPPAGAANGARALESTTAVPAPAGTSPARRDLPAGGAARIAAGALPRLAAAATALVAAASVWAAWRYFVGTRTGQLYEHLALAGSTRGKGTLWGIVKPWLDVIPWVGVIGLLVAVAVALARRRWALVLQVTVMVLGANATAQFLKYVVFDRVNMIGGWNYHNTLPSGHTTLAASIAAAFVLVAPRRLRPLVAILGAAYAAAMGISTLIGQWHRPSDVGAAIALVLAWSAAVCAVTTRSGRDRDWGGRWWTSAAVALLGIVAAVALLSVWAAVERVGPTTALRAPFARSTEITCYVGGAAAVVACAALAFAVLLLLRQATARPAPGA